MTTSTGMQASAGGKMQFKRPPLFENLDGLLTYSELSKALGVAQRTLRDWVQHGKIPYRRMGPKFIRFSKADIAHWLDNQGVKS